MPKKVKTKYTAAELKVFEKLINKKKETAQKELDFIKESLLRKHLAGTDSTQGALKTLEDGADTMEKESLSQLAGRQQKFINNLENALIRIKNGTYGICKDTGKFFKCKRKASTTKLSSIGISLSHEIKPIKNIYFINFFI